MRRARTVRLFAYFAVCVMVLAGFSVLSRVAAAEDATLDSSTALVGTGSSYESGGAVIPLADGTVQNVNLATFQRWDGITRPWSALNWSTGDWPFSVTETATAVTISRLGRSFVQGKVAGANYSYRTNGLKETLVLDAPPPLVVVDPTIDVPFATTYGVAIEGTTVRLFDSSGAPAWTSAPFEAWDSAEPARVWDGLVTSVTYSGGVLSLHLEPAALASATYPLYIDPTWTLGGAAGWGSSTFQDATMDAGDGSVKIGWLADNFNDNTNDLWTVSGATISGGKLNLPGTGNYAYHAATWLNLNAQFDVYFGGRASPDWARFMFGLTSEVGSSNSLYIKEESDQLTLSSPDGTPWVQLSVPISTKTWYTVRLVAQGNYFEIWWNGVRKFAGTVGMGTASGGVEFRSISSATISVDNVRVWNTNVGTLTTPVRDAGANRPLQTQASGTVDAYNQVHVEIRSSSDNTAWGPWTIGKADLASGILYNLPDQSRLRYYRLRLTLTTGTDSTPALTQVSTVEGTPPTPSPTANSGYAPWHPYVDGIVNAVNGNLFYRTTDISFQGRGFPLAVVRSYNSARASINGPFGNGWTFNYAETLTVNADNSVTWLDGTGAAWTFLPKGSTGGYAPPAGIQDRLIKNPDGTFTLWKPDGSQERFNSAGRLTTLVDRNGNKLTMSYSSGNPPRLTAVTDDAGKSLTFTYDASKHIISVRDPGGRTVTYAYNSGYLGRMTDPLQKNWTYGYYGDNPQYLKDIIDPLYKDVQVIYGTGNKVTTITLAQGLLYSYVDYAITYTSPTSVSVTNARGYTTTLTLNSFGNVVQMSGPSIGCGCDSPGNASSYLWDGEMNRVTSTDGRGNAWSAAYGFRGNLLTTTDPGGNVSSGTWLEANNATNYFVVPASTTTFRGFTTTMAYDAKGNLVSVADPGGNTTRIAYDGFGFLNKTVSARGYTTWFSYNASGWLVRVVDPMNDVTQYAYDVLGRPTTVTSPMGFVTTTAYDADSRVRSVTDPLQHATTYGYNDRGDRTSVTDADQLTTTYTFNVTNGRVQTTTDAGGNTTTYAYDPRDNLVAVTDANGHTTTYAYDSYDRLESATVPMGEVTSYAYDAAGNRIRRTDGNGAMTRYAYDGLNRLIQIRYPGLPVYPSPQTLTYAYDQDGNLVSAAGFGYTETRTHDRSDRLASTTFAYGPFSATVAYAYDKDGNRATLKDSSNGVTQYFYDHAGRLTGILDPEGLNTTLAYDRDSRTTQIAMVGGVRQVTLYDRASRLTAIFTNGTSGTIQKIEYTYDDANYRLSQRDTVGSTVTTTAYAYDRLHRIYSATQGTSTTTWTHDAVGNVVQEGTPATETYVHNANNEMIWANSSGGIDYHYAYDDNGNEISQNDQEHGSYISYAYDYENRLIGSNRGCSFTYSPTGERISANCGGTLTYYGYDYGSPGGTPNLIAEYTSTGSRLDRYTHSGGLNSPVEQFTSGGHYAYSVDGLGSVRRLTDGNGATVSTYAYDTWGGTTQTGTLANPFQYAAMPLDPTDSLYDARARFYDPSTAGGHRFLSQDPLGGGYVYAQGSPTNFVDPTGLRIGSCAPNCGVPPGVQPVTGPGGEGGVGTSGEFVVIAGDDWIGRGSFVNVDPACVARCAIDMGGAIKFLGGVGGPLGVFICGSVCGNCGGLISMAWGTGGAALAVPEWWIFAAFFCGTCIKCLADFVSCLGTCYSPAGNPVLPASSGNKCRR